jgi:hypothetical protein
MTVPGFSRVSSARLRKNRGNYGLILVLWSGFVVFTIVDDGGMKPSAWFAAAVIAVVLAAVVVSELELRSRAALERVPSVESAPTVVVETPTHLVEWPEEVHHAVPAPGRAPVGSDGDPR